ncbi:hypothetical protein GF407_06480 [candidate division KSB1 bacterium]|nr:hypothetical protein [candidate division KSB1 bacterium]
MQPKIKKRRGMAIFLFLLVFATIHSSLAYEWALMGEMPIPVAAGEAVVYQNKIYILGGYTEGATEPVNLIQRYDPFLLNWLTVDTLQSGCGYFSAAISNDSLLYWGGTSTDTLRQSALYLWKPPAGPHQILSGDPVFGRMRSAGLVQTPFLYIVGGFSDNAQPIPYLVRFNLNSMSVEFAENELFADNPPYQQMVTVFAGDLYLFGGVQNNVSNKIYKFDSQDHSFEQVAPRLLSGRAGGCAVKTDPNNLFLIGGYNDLNSAMTSTERVVFSAGEEHTIYSGPELNIGRREAMAIYYDGAIYLFGGYDSDGHVVPKIEKLNLQATAVDKENKQPTVFELQQNYPNPFNQVTTIPYSLCRNGYVSVDIYATTGEHIKTLVNGYRTKGHYQLKWDGRDQNGKIVSSGIYYVWLKTDQSMQTKKLLFIR